MELLLCEFSGNSAVMAFLPVLIEIFALILSYETMHQ